MNNQLELLSAKFTKEVQQVQNPQSLNLLRTKYLGRKGELNLVLRSLSQLSLKERKEMGSLANSLKKQMETTLSEKETFFHQKEKETLKEEWFDISLPGVQCPEGHPHLVTLVYNELFRIFGELGFQVAEGPEIETDWYNFEALNIPKDHPARDTQDSFFFNDNLLLRTHTSPVQIRVMEKQKPPIRIIVPGRTYRRDSDATHTPMFHQLEGLLVDERTTFSDLKGTLEFFSASFFGPERKLRFRPHHFPFTEPSAEVDISCDICKGKGCRACKYSGWLEILGSGMVHPNVLENCGIDSKKYRGFAFGMGIERLAMLKYNINDLRLFYENDLRFLEQF